MLYQHLLLATDLADDALIVGRKALAIAQQFGARFSVIHVIENIPSYASGYVGIIDIEIELEEEAKKHLAEFSNQLNIPPSNQFIENGSPKNKILEVAKNQHVDLIIVGSHGRHGISWLLGATASVIVHGADCDVLTIQCKEEPKTS